MKYLFLLLCFQLISCASYQNGHKAVESTSTKSSNTNKPVKSKILVTAYQDREYSTAHFSYIQVEFGNKSDEWFEVNKVLLKYKGSDLQIVLGKRLVDWGKSIKNKVAVDRHNTQMIYGAIAATATIGGYNSARKGNIAATESYVAVMSGAALAGSVNQLSNEISDLERSTIFPSDHLYSPFSTPPGLVSKKWILLQHAPGAQIEKLVFEVFLKNGDKKSYSVTIY